MAIDTEERTSSVNNSASSGSTNNKKILTIILAIVGVIVILSIVGVLATGFLFKKGAEKLIESSTGGKATINTNKDGGEVTIKGDDGKDVKIKAGADKKLSHNFPKSDIPIYKGAKIVGTSDITTGGVTTFTVALSTKDNPNAVVEYYKNELSGNGWENLYSSNTDDGSMVNFQNKSKKLAVMLSATINEDEKVTDISLIVRLGDDEDI